VSLHYTFDTGALIALERRHQRMSVLWRLALAHRARITVPAVVVAEWWRADSRVRSEILRAVSVEPTTLRLARLAGEAIAATGATVTDAIVAASAALRGDVIVTSDPDDLQRLRTHFRSIASVLAV
jgi:predicted nucleic acid-binding protein